MEVADAYLRPGLVKEGGPPFPTLHNVARHEGLVTLLRCNLKRVVVESHVLFGDRFWSFGNVFGTCWKILGKIWKTTENQQKNK